MGPCSKSSPTANLGIHNPAAKVPNIQVSPPERALEVGRDSTATFFQPSKMMLKLDPVEPHSEGRPPRQVSVDGDVVSEAYELAIEVGHLSQVSA